jgi:hypothetical protein
MSATRFQLTLTDLIGLTLLVALLMHIHMATPTVILVIMDVLLGAVVVSMLTCVGASLRDKHYDDVPTYLRLFLWFYLGFVGVSSVAFIAVLGPA